MGKKVLLFAEHFAPEATPSAVRPTKLAKFLTASGYSVTVVTKRRVLQTDELLRQDLKSCGRIYRAMPRGDLKAARPIRSKADDPGKGGNLFSRLLRAIRRTLSAIRAAWRNESFAKAFLSRLYAAAKDEESFDYLISTDPELSNHLAALEYKKTHPNVFWIADFCRFQDPTDPHLWNAYRRRLLKKVIRHCGVCTAADQNLKKALETLSKRSVLVRVIPQGYDPEDLMKELVRRFAAQEQDPNVFRILAVADERHDPDEWEPVFRAVSELIAERRMDREKLSFTIYGKSEDTAFCLETAEKFGLSPHVRDMGAQSRARFLAAQRSAQALIASAKDLEDFHSPLPLHLYEQILMQKPVIGIALGEGLDSELYQLIRECRLGFCYEQSEGAASFGALKKYLAESYLYYFTRAKELYEPNLKACARYAYGNLITLWKELLQDDSF